MPIAARGLGLGFGDSHAIARITPSRTSNPHRIWPLRHFVSRPKKSTVDELGKGFPTVWAKEGLFMHGHRACLVAKPGSTGTGPVGRGTEARSWRRLVVTPGSTGMGSMGMVLLHVLMGLALVPDAALAAGMARNENFVVLAPDDALAHAVLRRADQLRRDVALEWLSRELPLGAGRTLINVKLSTTTTDRAFSWPVGQSNRNFHWIWVTASRQRILGSTLRHEITHAVLATQFSGQLPRWADEGAASLSDDAERKAARVAIVDAYVQSGTWPDLRSVLEQKAVSAADWQTYSVAASMVEYLMTRRDQPTVLAFAETGRERGWDAAAQMHYGVQSLDELEAGWREWAGQTSRATVSRSHSVGIRQTHLNRPRRWPEGRTTARRPIPTAGPSSNSVGS
jgi:hypothetical protein